ncbi:MAG: anaerobic ribonucleoside-triphosphate reductase activating protein [Mycoplasma sp.]
MNYIKIDNSNLVNGEGCRVVLWVAGCTHACKNCHNKETWNFEIGKKFTNETLKELKMLMDSKYIDGLTISGGDPLNPLNIKETTMIAKEIKKTFPDKNIWVWTGYEMKVVEKLPILKYIDVLIDGKYIEELKTTKKWRGSDNQVRWNKIDDIWVKE